MIILKMSIIKQLRHYILQNQFFLLFLVFRILLIWKLIIIFYITLVVLLIILLIMRNVDVINQP